MHTGTWGLAPAIAHVVREGDITPEAVMIAVKGTAWFAHMQEAVVEWGIALFAEMGIQEWMWSEEICPSDLEALRAVCCVHTHVVLLGFSQQLRVYAAAACSGTCGFALACPVAHGAGRNRGHGAFLYVQARKIAKVASGGNVVRLGVTPSQKIRSFHCCRVAKLTCGEASCLA